MGEGGKVHNQGINSLSSTVRELYWSVPILWPNSTCFIIGGGPSIRGLDLGRIAGKWPSIVCNLGFLDFPWADVMFFGDCKVHTWISREDGGRYRARFDSYSGLKVSCCPDTRNDPRIKTLFKISRGIVKERRSIGWNSNSGAAAINLAYHFGARKVVLLGFDMHRKDNRDNYHDYHLVKNKHDVYHKFLRNFRRVAEDATKLGLEIINCCMDSSLELFPKISYGDVLECESRRLS